MVHEQLGYKSLVECVTEYLKKQLNSKELIPGQEINLASISATLGISRTPVREALLQLSKEGLVEVLSRRKFCFAKLTMDDLGHLYSLIGLLEAEAAKPACGRMLGDDIAKLRELYEGMAAALDRGDACVYMSMNTASHDLIIKYCENPILAEVIRNLKERMNLIFYDFEAAFKTVPEWEVALLSDHLEMINAIASKNKKALRHVIQDVHWGFRRNFPFLLRYFEFINATGMAPEENRG